MPVFDYLCPSCGRRRNDEFVHRYDVVVKCLQCKSKMSKLVPNSAKFIGARVFPSDGVHLEHVGPKGKTFRSEKEMRKYEREHDVELGYLL